MFPNIVLNKYWTNTFLQNLLRKTGRDNPGMKDWLKTLKVFLFSLVDIYFKCEAKPNDQEQ